MAAKQAEPENQAELVPGRDPDKIKNFKFFFQIIKSTTLLVQHVKGQPDSSRFVLEEGGVTFDTNRGTPCRMPAENMKLTMLKTRQRLKTRIGLYLALTLIK